MALTPEQLERVRYLLMDEWVSETSGANWTDFDRVLEQMSAEELHAFAGRMNWDGGGSERLMRVLQHPRCDRGTALLIYWRADPVFYLKYGSREKVAAELWPDALDNWDMLRYIEQRLLGSKSFATAHLAYDPTNDNGRDRTQQRRKNRPIPKLEKRSGKFVIVGEQPVPDDPEIDVRGSLPAVVFELVGRGADA